MVKTDLVGLTVLSQTLLGSGLFAIVSYRCYLQTSGVRDLRKEFATYGLPAWCVHLVCVVEFGLAFLFTAGIVFDQLVLPTNAVLLVMMLGAMACRIKAITKGNEPYYKAIPALLFGALAGFDLAVHVSLPDACIAPAPDSFASADTRLILIAIAATANFLSGLVATRAVMSGSQQPRQLQCAEKPLLNPKGSVAR
eukprot:gnl/TRDRNA2_/TRDRNA2_189730_c0_seq1.p1 gnl/TRDRNA2_/TRDRNA2_189730_c0~~gnl/TRDRNA2_/TRDRNA2_189730_c0_seq1.p1  ORF type:complete len:196 (+),score=3.51 gnl/TRDRNA2_/TRDRNA2_189730_c0_seq1:139-726(+)